MPIDGAAVNFNLYEDTDDHWSIQLIVSSYFDEVDPDWCCDEKFTTGEDLLGWKQEVKWDEILDIAINLIQKCASILCTGIFLLLESVVHSATK